MNVLVAGGGTIAPIDDVRAITNASTGRFAASISEAWLESGATVRHLHTPTAELPYLRSSRFDLNASDLNAEHRRIDRLAEQWRSCRERLRLVPLAQGTVGEYAQTLETLLRAEPADVIFLATAVSDYEPEPRSGKIGSDEEGLILRCRRTPKVIRSVRDWAPSSYLVGFKLLSRVSPDELIAQASRACLINRADLTVANDLQTLREGRHTVHLVRPGHPAETIGPGPDLARTLVERVVAWARDAKRGGSGTPSRSD
jgi:phosphopantothenate-cysteine ligase